MDEAQKMKKTIHLLRFKVRHSHFNKDFFYYTKTWREEAASTSEPREELRKSIPEYETAHKN